MQRPCNPQKTPLAGILCALINQAAESMFIAAR
jgi:hypothetical protein